MPCGVAVRYGAKTVSAPPRFASVVPAKWPELAKTAKLVTKQ
jgi:hypothetical protein